MDVSLPGPLETLEAATLAGRRLLRTLQASADRIQDRRIDRVSVAALAPLPNQRLVGGGRQRDEQARRGLPGVLDRVWHAAVEVARIARVQQRSEEHTLELQS